MNPLPCFLESLEDRIAPAVIIDASGKVGTFTDSDGDQVTVKVTKGTLTSGLFTTSVVGDGEQLENVDLTDPQFNGTDIIFSAARNLSNGGDGFVNVGRIDASANVLGKLVIPGDLGQINVGDSGTSAGQAIKSMTVGSIGAFNTDTGASADLQSNIFGSIGSLLIKGDMQGKFVVNGSTMDGTTGGIGSLRVTGSVIGGADYTGWFQISGQTKSIWIGGSIVGSGVGAGRVEVLYGSTGSFYLGGDILGGTGQNAGSVAFTSNIAGKSFTVRGDIAGGSAAGSGFVSLGNGGFGKVTVGEDLVGGSGESSGSIFVGSRGADVSVGGSFFGGSGEDSAAVWGSLKSVKIGGSVFGGSGLASGSIEDTIGEFNSKISLGGSLHGGSGESSGLIELERADSIKIGGSLLGGSTDYAGSIYVDNDVSSINIRGNLVGGNDYYTGVIYSGGAVKSINIGGSMMAGTSNGEISGWILSNKTIGSVTIGGDMKGSSGGFSGKTVTIMALGLGSNLPESAKQDVAIGKVYVGGSATFANIVGGYNSAAAGVNGDASLGSITVRGDWVASSASTGIDAGADTYFGSAAMNDDFNLPSPTGRTDLTATIASVLVGGQIRGTYGMTGDSFAIQGQQLSKLKIGSVDYSSELTGPAATIFLGPVFSMLSDIRAIEKPV